MRNIGKYIEGIFLGAALNGCAENMNIPLDNLPNNEYGNYVRMANSECKAGNYMVAQAYVDSASSFNLGYIDPILETIKGDISSGKGWTGPARLSYQIALELSNSTINHPEKVRLETVNIARYLKPRLEERLEKLGSDKSE
mgnify:CR=1 FL=1